MSHNDSNQPVWNQMGQLGMYPILWNLILSKSDGTLFFRCAEDLVFPSLLSLYFILWMSEMAKPPLEPSPASSFQDSKIKKKSSWHIKLPKNAQKSVPKAWRKPQKALQALFTRETNKQTIQLGENVLYRQVGDADWWKKERNPLCLVTRRMQKGRKLLRGPQQINQSHSWLTP